MWRLCDVVRLLVLALWIVMYVVMVVMVKTLVIV